MACSCKVRRGHLFGFHGTVVNCESTGSMIGNDNQDTAVFFSEIKPCPGGTIKIDHCHNNPPIIFTKMV